MEQRKNGIHNEVIVDADKENRSLSIDKDSTLITKAKQLNRQTLLTIQSKGKLIPLNSVGKLLNDGTKSALQTNLVGSKSSNIKSTEPKLQKTSTSRKSMTKWKCDSVLNINPLAKKISVHPTKPMKGKSVQSNFPHQNPAIGSETTGLTDSSKKTFAVPSDKFPCNSCKKTFFFKTTLEAHKKSHAAVNSCQFCQRTFALSTALLKHLKEHCTKISIGERKKLLAADDKTPDLDRTSHKTSQKTPISIKHSTDELLEFVSRSCSTSQSIQLKASIEYFPPIKGVYQTPKKLIKCYRCNETFKLAFLFASHAEQCTVDSK